MAKFDLTDDGTLDTVFRCSECGEEVRCNYDPSGPDRYGDVNGDKDDSTAAYDAWIDEMRAEIEDEHVCGASTAGD